MKSYLTTKGPKMSGVHCVSSCIKEPVDLFVETSFLDLSHCGTKEFLQPGTRLPLSRLINSTYAQLRHPKIGHRRTLVKDFFLDFTIDTPTVRT